MKRVINVTFVLFVVFIYGCAKSDLNADDYVKYVESEKNNIKNTKQIEDLSFSLQYCPTEYLLLKEYKTNNLSEKLIDQRKKDNDSMVFFKLRISAKNNNDILNYQISSNDDYYQRIQYLSYGFEEDIALLNGKDTIFPALFHFERTYGVVPFADFMLAFNTKIKEPENFQVILDDKVFNTGLLKFSYSNKDIQDIPKLKTN